MDDHEYVPMRHNFEISFISLMSCASICLHTQFLALFRINNGVNIIKICSVVQTLLFRISVFALQWHVFTFCPLATGFSVCTKRRTSLHAMFLHRTYRKQIVARISCQDEIQTRGSYQEYVTFTLSKSHLHVIHLNKSCHKGIFLKSLFLLCSVNAKQNFS